MPETVRIVIIDDHPIVRAGLRQVLEAAAGMAVVAEGASGADALRLLADSRPDVLVLDVNLPDMSGVEVMRRAHERDVPTPILILTIHDDRETVLGLLEAGAAGYVLKEDAAETLAGAVRAVARGDSWLSPKIVGHVLRRARGETPTEPLSPLTPREVEVLRLLARGLDNEAIAGRLVLSRRTVQNHVSAIYGKLGIASRAEAVLYALSHQLAAMPPTEPGADAS
jgi:DNA-binding NarL/FixJ family response regulator